MQKNGQNINSPEIANSPQPTLPNNGYCSSSFLLNNANNSNSHGNFANSLISGGLLANGLLNGNLLSPNAAVAINSLNSSHLTPNSLSTSNQPNNDSTTNSRIEQLSNSTQYNAIYQHYLASLMANSNVFKQLNTTNLTPTTLNNTTLNNSTLNNTTNCSTSGQLTNLNNTNDTVCTLGQSISKLEPIESKAPLYFV